MRPSKNTSRRRRSKTKLTIDEVPLSKNEYLDFGYRNHSAIKRKRKEYKERIYWLMYKETYLEEIHAEYPNGKHPLKKATITFDIYFKVKRNRDKQNYLGGGLIAWLDAMVNLEIIKDDSADCIGQPIVNFYIDKYNPRTEIIIEGR